MMRLKPQVEKWAAGILGIVCLALVVNIVFESGGKASAARPSQGVARTSAESRSPSPGPRALDELARYDPELNLDLLEKLDGRPFPEISRNPFEYPPPPSAAKSAKAGENGPAAPPPPPPLPLKAIGYSVKNGGVPEAVITDEEDIYVVHVGETFGKRYQVMSLTPNRVEIHDSSTQQVVQLPIAP
jgi:hypothetical protein